MNRSQEVEMVSLHAAYDRGFRGVDRWIPPRTMPEGRLDGAKVGRRGWQERAAEAAGREDRELHRRAAREEDARRREAARLAGLAHIEELNAKGQWELGHPYGDSYFGSGGGWGYVRGAGVKLEGTRDNGFMAGPAFVVVLDPTQPAVFVALGGDCIGEGRSWSEGGRWDPTTHRWEPLSAAEREHVFGTLPLLPSVPW
jgi:hypothetical protein